MAKSIFRCLTPFASQKLREERGNVAIIFALSATVLSLSAAAAVDVSRMNSAKDSLNRIADATALAAKRTQVDRQSALGEAASRTAGETAAANFFNSQTPAFAGFVRTPTFTTSWDADGSARIVASAEAPLIFGGFINREKVNISAVAVATAGGEDELEIAMLLDTTASMFQKDGRTTTRFTLLRSASKDFVNTMFDNISVPDKMRIAVIPWTTTVNIRTETPAAWNRTAAGAASVADKGNQQLAASTMSRTANMNKTDAQLVTDFAPVGWRGCIAGTGESLTANDDIKTGMKWDALQVMPQLRNRTFTRQESYTTTCSSTVCPPSPPGPPPPPKGPSPPSPPSSPPPPPPPPTQGAIERLDRMFAFAGQHRSMNYSNVACTTTTWSCSQCRTVTSGPTTTVGTHCTPDDTNGSTNAYVPTDRACINQGSNCTGTPAAATLRSCVSDPNEITYNNGGGRLCSGWVPTSTWTQHDAIVGPNLNCPMPMLGLSGSRPQIMSTIDRLSPSPGGTHGDVGLRWGMRALSPKTEWASFFGISAKPPGAFGTNSNSRKMMVLITDGENQQAVDFPGYWGCSKTSNGICTGSPDRATLDSRMLSWCTAIRNNGVELYTVAVNVSDPTAVSLLATCAGDSTRAFSVDAGQLGTAFTQIAKDAFRLRIKE